MTAQIEHPSFKQPDNINISIWRYMDFTKFVAMLENDGLFFCRADCLGDAFEGSNSRANEYMRPKVYEEECKKLNISIEKLLEVLKKHGDILRWQRQWMMVSCWHMNEYESAAMWNLYAKSNEAVCIQSTYQRLVNSLPEQAYVGCIQYIDYRNDWMPEGNLFTPFMHKRKSFEHEREIRAIIDKSPKAPRAMEDETLKPPPSGIWVKVNLRQLIQNIYVAPQSPEWFRDLVDRVKCRYNLTIDVIRSSLEEEPFF